MSDILAKYRPTSIEELIASENVKAEIQTIFDNPSKYHVYLLAGPSGIGKTTIARMFGKYLDPDNSIEYYEVNCGDDRKIDDAREWLKLMQSRPLTSKYRVIVLDEAHQLTGPAQQSILKGMEDTPEQNYIFICSTNPEALLDTILTRCKIVDLTPDIDSLASDYFIDQCLALLLRMAANEEKDLDTCFIPPDEPRKMVMEYIHANIYGFSFRRMIMYFDNYINTENDKTRITIQNEPKINLDIFVNYLRNQMKKFGKVTKDSSIQDFPCLEADWEKVGFQLSKIKPSMAENLRIRIVQYFTTILVTSDNVSDRKYAEYIISVFVDKKCTYLPDAVPTIILMYRGVFLNIRKMAFFQKTEITR